MSEENIFEYAVKYKLRYPYKGLVTTEDLYSLSVTELDKIYKILNKEAKLANEESLLERKDRKDKDLSVKIAMIEHIVKDKLADVEKAKKAKENREKRQMIYEIMAKRDAAALEKASDKELQKMLDSLV